MFGNIQMILYTTMLKHAAFKHAADDDGESNSNQITNLRRILSYS
jgi:hypothetical protein